MRVKLETVLSTLGILTAVAYTLGWLQAFYYFDSFGIRLAAVGMSPQDYLLNSWFVVENVLFFLVLLWAIASRPAWWTVLIGILYSLIPIGAHYAFFVPNWWGASILIEYRHTLLKFIPFAVLLAVISVEWRQAQRPIASALALEWRHSTGIFVLLIIIVAAWSISVAKHFGSFDANLELRYPDRMLAQVQLHTPPDADRPDKPVPSNSLYLVHATPTLLFVWDSSGFLFGQPDQKVKVYTVPREQVTFVETRKPFHVQRGGFVF